MQKLRPFILLVGLCACADDATDTCLMAPASVTVNADTDVPVRTRVNEEGVVTHTLTTTGTTNLTGASIVVEAARTRLPIADALVGNAYNATIASDACGKAFTVDYELDPASHHLWVTGTNGTHLLGLAEAALRTTAIVTPAHAINGFTNPSDPAFGFDGSLWVIDANTIHRFTPEVLVSGVRTASVVLAGTDIEGPGIPGPRALAFDSSGNLWVANIAGDSVSRFDAADLEVSGSPSASVIITGSSLAAPTALAFDAEGNLWIGNADGNVVGYMEARLGTDINTAPDFELRAETSPPVVAELTGPEALAFDAAGNLWVAYFAANTLVRFTAAERAAAQPLRPAIEITLPVDVLLESIAFDDEGGLWFTSAQGKIARLDSTALAVDGAATGTTILTVSELGSASGLAFDPPSVELPLAFSAF